MQTKYRKYINFSLVVAVICLVSASLFSSCKDNDEDEDDGTIVLNSYGPMPIARGAELRFIGKNLDKITAIVLPGDIEIPASEFGTKTSTLVTITVPQNAIEGLVVVKTPQGDITTKTPIGFSEPISIETFSPALIKADSVLTITGDYLNLIKQVLFTDRVTVDAANFISQSRHELKVKVPAAARTGKIGVSNGAEDPIIVYTNDNLNVVLPGITSFSPNPVKAGTKLTIKGTDLDLVKNVSLGGNQNVNSFVSQTATEIILTVPDATQDDTISVIPASGVKIKSSSKLIMMVPTVSIANTIVKNGSELTVTGTNLDLVDKVVFGGNKNGIIKAGGSSDAIVVTVPNDAISGIVKFVTKATKEVNGPSLVIIDPVISSVLPTSTKAKTDLTITGTDLDLVVDVLFVGGVKGTINSGRTETQLVVTIPVGAKTGKITFITKNGQKIESSQDLTILANLPEITGFTETSGVRGKILTLNGTNMLLIKQLVFPGNLVATEYGMKSDTKVEVYVPEKAKTGFGNIKLFTYEGEEGLSPEIFISGPDKVLNETLCFFNFNGTGKDSWWGNAIGSGISSDASLSGDGTPFWRINGMSGSGWWDGLFFRNGSNNFVTTGVDANTWAVRFDINVAEPITTGILKIRFGSYFYEFKPWEGVSGGYKTVGWVTVTCPLSGFKDGSKVLTDPSVGGSEFGMVWASGTSVKVNMSIDNVRFEPIP